MQFETWGLEAKKKKKNFTDIYNLENEGRVASKLISSIFRSETELCLSACAWSILCVLFPSCRQNHYVQNSDGMEAMFWLASSLQLWQYYKFEGVRPWRGLGIKLLGKALWMAAPLPCIMGEDKLGHPNSTFPECTHLGAMCHGLWPPPDPPLPNPFPASWPLHCSSNPSLTPHPSVLTAPEPSWRLNQSIFLKAGREAGQPYLEGPKDSQKSYLLNPVWVCGPESMTDYNL